MPLDVIRSFTDEMLSRLVRSIPPRQVVAQIAKLDRRVYFRYFKGYRADKVTRTQMLDCVQKEVLKADNETMSELLVVAWNAANWNLYEAMRKNVAKINPNVEEIERIEDDQAKDILAELAEEFESEDIWICTVLNEVRFTPEFKATLAPTPEDAERAAALAAKKAEESAAEKAADESAAVEPAEESAAVEPAEESAEDPAGAPAPAEPPPTETPA